MSYLMMCTNPEIYLNGGVRITKKGEQFTIDDKVTRDLLIENKNAIDITNGVPADKTTDKDILLVQLDSEKAKNDALAKELAELRQQLKNQPEGSEPVEIPVKSKKGGS